jgi:hypothetical protein
MDDVNDYQQQFVKQVIANQVPNSWVLKVKPVGKLTISEMIDVYHRDYFARLTSALGENLETCWAVLGDEDFFKIAKEYITQFPSDQSDLNQMSKYFYTFLSSHPISKDFPFLPKIAHFEHSYWELFHAAPSGESLVDWTQQEVFLNSKCEFFSNVKIFSFDFQMSKFWSLREKGFNETTLEQFMFPQHLLLFKHVAQVETRELTSNQYQILQNLMNKKTFVETINELGNEIDVNPQEVQELFEMIHSHQLIEKLS